MSKGINKKLEKQSGMSNIFDMPLPHTKSLSRKNGSYSMPVPYSAAGTVAPGIFAPLKAYLNSLILRPSACLIVNET